MTQTSPSKKTRNRYYTGPISDHFDGTFFFNPEGEAPLGFRELMRWQFGGGRSLWPKQAPSPFPPAKPDERIDGDIEDHPELDDARDAEIAALPEQRDGEER